MKLPGSRAAAPLLVIEFSGSNVVDRVLAPGSCVRARQTQIFPKRCQERDEIKEGQWYTITFGGSKAQTGQARELSLKVEIKCSCGDRSWEQIRRPDELAG